VFVVSDFISEPGWEQALARLARATRWWPCACRPAGDGTARRRPGDGAEDAETGEQLLVDAADPPFASATPPSPRSRRAAAAGLAHAGADTLELATDDDLLDALLRFADLRRSARRLQGAGGAPAHMRRRPRSIGAQPEGAPWGTA
jgi:hypothetical protein